MAKEPKELLKTKTLQVKILKRYLSKKELERFMKEYQGHKQNWGGSNRFIGMSQPLEKKQRENLFVYLFDESGQSIGGLSRERNQSYGEFINAAYKGAMRILYQNRDKLKLKELLEGGE